MNGDELNFALYGAVVRGECATIARLIGNLNGRHAVSLYQDRISLLHVAARNNRVEAAELLLKGGAHVEYREKDQMTPLHEACANGSVDVAKLLVEQFGADVNARDVCGFTPLHLACKKNDSWRLIKWLAVRQGTDLNLHDRNGFSPLLWASGKGSWKAVKLFLSHGACNIPDILKAMRVTQSREERNWLE